MNMTRCLILTIGLALATASAQADDYGTISGQVTLAKVPPAPPVNVTTDKAHCLGKGPIVDNTYIVDPKSKGLKNVVIWLRPATNNRRDVFPQEKIFPAWKKPQAINTQSINHVASLSRGLSPFALATRSSLRTALR